MMAAYLEHAHSAPQGADSSFVNDFLSLVSRSSLCSGSTLQDSAASFADHWIDQQMRLRERDFANFVEIEYVFLSLPPKALRYFVLDRVFLTTWNINNRKASDVEPLSSWIKSQPNPPAIVAIGASECCSDGSLLGFDHPNAS